MRTTIRLCIATFALSTVGLLALAGAPARAATITVPAQVTAQSWTVVPAATTTPALPGDSTYRVSCVTSTFCMSVGGQGIYVGLGSPEFTTLIQQWNGTTWATVASPNPTGATNANLVDVSCSSTTFCMAVGVTDLSSTDVPLAEQWNGSTWSMTTLTGLSAGADLSAVSCTSTTSCTAIGGLGDDGLAAQWNGSTWTTSTMAPPTGATFINLTGLSCTSTTFCMADGFTSTPGNVDGNDFVETTLTEEWNGTSWAIVNSPNLTTEGENELTDLSCIGSNWCTAVGDGFTTNTSTFVDLVESWNGSAWSISATPTLPAGDGSSLLGVSCFSATSCTAVGSTGVNRAGSQSLTQALTWNGQSWATVTTPDAPATPTADFFTGVDCLSDWACAAVGTAPDGSNHVPFDAIAPIARSGYRFVASDGGVFAEGAGAPFLGSLGGTVLNKPIVGMAVMPASDGYYLVASDGGVFAFGSAQFYGSTGSLHLNKPIVGMALTADGAGYWLVASDGGIFAFGDANFYGSMGGTVLNQPIVGMAATPNGLGYWLVASDGGVFAFGNAAFEGSTGSVALNKPIVGMAAATSGGYYLVASDGGIFSFPTTNGPPFEGSTGSIHLNKPIIGMTTVANGYYLGASDGGVFTFPTTNGPPFLGSQGGTPLNKPIVGIAS